MLMEKALFCCEMGEKDGMKQWNNHLPFGIWIGKFTTILPWYNFMFIEDNKMILSYFLCGLHRIQFIESFPNWLI